MKKSALLPAIVLVLFTACGKNSTGPTVTSVTVSPSSASLTALGQTQQFTATALDGGGSRVTGETVTWSSSDETVATVSGTGLATAVGVGSATITATVAGVPGTASLDVSISQPSGECTDTVTVSLTAGEYTSFSGTSTCVMLPSGNNGDEYRVAVVEPTSSETSDTAHVTLSLTGIGVTSAPPAQTAPTAAAALETPPLLTPDQEASLLRSAKIAEATERFHLAMRAKERELLQTHLLPKGGLNLPAPTSSIVVQGPAAASPAKRTFFVSTDCSKSTAADQATGILIDDSNPDLVFYQDSAQNATNPVSLSSVQQMEDYYSSYAKDMIKSYFGQPSDIDGNGKVIVFISPVVSGGTAAFVWGGDFFPTTTSDSLGLSGCAASNYGEIIYFSNNVISYMDDSKPSYQALATVAHEMKHVVSLYHRIRYSVAAGSAAFQPGWVEEGTAEIAGEMSSRIAWAANGGPPVGAKVTRTDIANASGGIAVTPEDYGVLLRMVRTIDYLSSQPNSLTSTPLGADSASNVYGSGWNFHRWLGDAYGGAATAEADSSLFRQLSDSISLAEPNGLQAATGQSFAQLFEQYVAAVCLTGTGAPEPSETFTTYDLVSATSNLLQNQPPGIYPWPVASQGFQTATFQGPIGAGGIRVHDFVSNGTGTGALVQVWVNSSQATPPPSKMIVVRVQ